MRTRSLQADALRVARIVAVAGVLCGFGWTQSSGPADQGATVSPAQQLQDVRKEMAALQKKVEALEVQLSARPPAEPASGAQEVAAAAQQPVQPSPESTASLHDMHGIQWRGFGEVNYKALDQRPPELGTYGFVPGSAGNFYTGDFDLYLHSRLNDKTSAQADITFEEVDAQSYKLDMRQALLTYDINEHVRVSTGRYQTGIGYYNSAYRTAAWLQTTADRPLIMEYASNGGLLPTQAVGVSMTGAVPSGKLNLNYLVQYGSSDTIRPEISGSGQLNDESDGNHVLLGLFARPDGVAGLQVGSSFFHDKITNNESGAPVRYGQTILNAYVVYVRHGLELLNEGFLIRHSALHATDVFNMPAFYTQVSRRFGRMSPFFRYQYANANPNSVFEDVQLRFGPSFGARYDLNDYIALKAQLDHTTRKGQPDLNGLHLQAAFTF